MRHRSSNRSTSDSPVIIAVSFVTRSSLIPSPALDPCTVDIVASSGSTTNDERLASPVTSTHARPLATPHASKSLTVLAAVSLFHTNIGASVSERIVIQHQTKCVKQRTDLIPQTPTVSLLHGVPSALLCSWKCDVPMRTRYSTSTTYCQY